VWGAHDSQPTGTGSTSAGDARSIGDGAQNVEELVGHMVMLVTLERGFELALRA
jgi:hypothetical protein